MEFLESLNDLAACIAVGVSIAPADYPVWSDGFNAHVAQIMFLWAEIRPQLRRDVEQAQRVEALMQEMTAAVDGGNTGGFQNAILALQRLDVSKLR